MRAVFGSVLPRAADLARRGGVVLAVGFAALVTMRRTDGRLAPPSEFVSAAEHAGLSDP